MRLGARGGRRRARAAAAIAAAAVLGGCGGGGGGSDEDAIRGVLEQLRAAQDSGDAELACTEVYAIREPDRPGETEAGGEGGSGDPEAEGEAEADGGGGEAGNADCEEAFRSATQETRAQVSGLSTEIGDIEVDGDTATAIVHTELRRADGSELAQDVPYDLVRTPEGWRVRIAEEG